MVQRELMMRRQLVHEHRAYSQTSENHDLRKRVIVLNSGHMAYIHILKRGKDASPSEGY